MVKIDYLVPFGDVCVPVGVHGKYLNWVGATEEYAPELRGRETFRIGPIKVEYVRMPGDSRIVLLDATDNGGLLHPEDTYWVYEDAEAVDAAIRLVRTCLRALKDNGLKHDEDEVGADPFYFQRVLAMELGDPGYADMNPTELRWGVDF